MAKNLLNELPVDFPKDKLKSVFDAYPKMDLTQPSSWLLWSGEKIKAHILEVCHASLRSDGAGWDDLITAVPKADEISLEYLRMLIRGPFRSMSDLIRLDRIKDNHYIHCMLLDKWPANVLMNFCIATRVPIEFEFLLKPWAKRCEAGFDATLAFLLTYSYGNDQTAKVRSFSLSRSGHMWLDAGSNWESILCGEMVKLSEPFKTNPTKITPANIIWGYSDNCRKLSTMSDEQVAEFYSVPIRVVEPPPPPKQKIKKVNFANYALQQLQAQQAQQAGQGIQVNPHALGAWMNEAVVHGAAEPQIAPDLDHAAQPDQPPGAGHMWVFDEGGQLQPAAQPGDGDFVQANNFAQPIQPFEEVEAVPVNFGDDPDDEDFFPDPDDDDEDDFDEIH